MPFTRAVVRRPSPNFADGLTRSELPPPAFALAKAQHDRYCETLERCGLKLLHLPIDPRHPDATFVEDTAILTDRGAIWTRPGAESRRGEVASVKEALLDLAPAVGEIDAPGTVDGGDVCEAGDHWFIGISARTNEEGARQVSELLAADGCGSSTVDIRSVEGILHLKSGIAWLSGRRLVAIEELAPHPAFAGWEIVGVDPGEEYAANCVPVNERVLFAKGFPRLEKRLSGLGYRPLVLDVSEYRKMDGGLSCLSLRFA